MRGANGNVSGPRGRRGGGHDSVALKIERNLRRLLCNILPVIHIAVFYCALALSMAVAAFCLEATVW